MIQESADRVWLMKISFVGWRERLAVSSLSVHFLETSRLCLVHLIIPGSTSPWVPNIKECLNTWCVSQAATFYDVGTQNLMPQQWWKLFTKVVNSMYFNCKYTGLMQLYCYKTSELTSRTALLHCSAHINIYVCLCLFSSLFSHISYILRPLPRLQIYILFWYEIVSLFLIWATGGPASTLLPIQVFVCSVPEVTKGK